MIFDLPQGIDDRKYLTADAAFEAVGDDARETSMEHNVSLFYQKASTQTTRNAQIETLTLCGVVTMYFAHQASILQGAFVIYCLDLATSNPT